MNGTWQGSYTGTNTGQIVVELDDMGDHFRGCVYAYDNNTGLPSTFAVIKTPDKGNKSKFTAPLVPLDPRIGEPTEWKNIAGQFQGVVFPTSAAGSVPAIRRRRLGRCGIVADSIES